MIEQQCDDCLKITTLQELRGFAQYSCNSCLFTGSFFNTALFSQWRSV
ncbi:hypothetical protein Mal52_37340 [Symmachiella dynata]|uniref:Uncharacterized protein n=1 Tax=Symmachiella dynata TaxID=2527995 RepID=A0A517ZS20_9PLAN|nr:hypothetical protein Mal52_37340 [Symmachiella dynata]